MRTDRLRRTLLWTKGHHQQAVEAALNSNTDCICFECEDMVIEPEKEAALKGACDAMLHMDFRGKEKIIRPNDINTDRGRRDIEHILPCKPDAIRLPKCEHAIDLLRLDERISKYEAEMNWPHNGIELILTIETPLGLINGYELASCCERISGIGLGAGDLTGAMDINRDLTPGSVQLLYAKQKMVMDGKAAGLQIFDTTVNGKGVNLDDFIKQDTEFIKNMGFTGRSVSILSHIDIINKVFAPTEEEVSLARRMIEGYDAGVKAGITEVYVDGKFVDPPKVFRMERILALDERIKRRIGMNK